MFTYELPSKSFSVDFNAVKNIENGLRGVYVARNEFGDCLYVGQSKALKNRLLDHLRKSPFQAYIDHFDVYIINEGFEREICETIFIDRMKPRYNRAKVFDEYDEDTARIVDDIEELEAERIELRDERSSLEWWLKRDLFTGDMDDDTTNFFDYYTDEDECRVVLLGEDLASVDRVEEITAEIDRISSRINYRYNLLLG